MYKILIIEDNQKIRDELAIFLNRNGYLCQAPDHFDDILLAVAAEKPHLILLPLILAIVHSVVGLRVANEAIASIGSVNAASNIIVTAGLILLVYGAYFLATYLGCRSMIGGRRMSL